MAFAMPLPMRSRNPRARMLFVRLVPAVLLGAGALLLAQPWRGITATASPVVATTAIEPSAVIGALLVVGGLLFFLPSILQRFSPTGRGAGRIGVLESRPLGGRKALLLVEVDGRRLLIGASETGLSMLAELGPGANRFEHALERELAAPSPSAALAVGSTG